jgi:hypothetical protein
LINEHRSARDGPINQLAGFVEISSHLCAETAF